MRRQIFIITIIFFVLSLHAVRGTPLIEDINSDAKIVSMGGAYEGGQGNSSAIIYNPAVISNMLKKEFCLSYGFYPEGVSHQSAIFSYPIEYGVLGAAISYFGEDKYHNLIGVFGYAHRVYKKDENLIRSQVASAGINLKVIDKNLSDENTTIFAADFGILFKLPFIKEFNLGLAFRNIAGEYELGEVRRRLPSLFELNLSKKNLIGGLNLAGNGGVIFDESIYFNAGTEYNITALRNSKVRIGLMAEENITPRVTGGVGVRYGGLSLDYGIVSGNKEGYPFHIISLRHMFGSLKEDPDDITRLYQSGKKYFLQGNLVDAQIRFEKVLLIDENYKETVRYLEQIKKAIGKLKKDEPLIEKELKKTQRLMKIGDILFDRNKYNEAIRYYIAVMVIDKRNVKAKQKISEAKRKIKEIEEAKRLSGKKEEATETEKKISKYYNTGLKYYDDKKYQSALSQYRQGLNMVGESRDSATWRGKFNKQIVKTRKKIAVRYYEKGYLYYQQNKFQEAVAEFEKALSYDRYYDEVKGKLKEVKEKLLQINKKKAEKLYEQGLNKYTLGNIESAIEMWEKALEYDSDHVEAKKALERAKARK